MANGATPTSTGGQSVWSSPGFTTTLFAVAAAFGSWSLLLPVVPLAVINSGGSKALAGATTAAFMAATVITQVFTPRAVRRFGYIKVMMAAAFILGVPSFLYVFSVAAAPVLIISAVRGVGFGAISVAQAALIAEIVPPTYLGKASGLLGFIIGLVQMIGLPVGLYMAAHISYDFTYIVGSVVAVAATLTCLKLPRVHPAPKPSAYTPASGGLPPVATWKLTTVPAITVSTFAMGYGALSSFMPAAIKAVDPVTGAVVSGVVLGVSAGSQMICRYGAGIIADRLGRAGKTTVASLVAGGVSMVWAGVVLSLGWSPWLLVITAVLFGAGFGAAQNEALMMMFARLPRSRVTDASALWNMAYDSGTGIGAAALGIIAGMAAGYAGAFATSGALIFFGLFVVWLDRVVGRHRIAERNNMRAKLRQVPVARKAYAATATVRRVGMTPVRVAGTLAKKATVRRPRPATDQDMGPEATERAAQRATAKQSAMRQKTVKASVPPVDTSPNDQPADELRTTRDAARRAARRSGRVMRKFARRAQHDDSE